MNEKKIRWWAVQRRIQYGVGFFSFWGLVGVLIYFVNFYQPPNCLDLVMNGDERGVDCGGSCVRVCASDAISPKVVWVDSFRVKDGQYNAVAYVENLNQVVATPELKYTFQLLNHGAVLAERTGTTVLPPNSVYPVFEGRVLIDSNQEVTETKLILEDVDIWIPASVVRDQFRSIDINLSKADSEHPRLDVEIENTDLLPAENVEVVATVFNELGEAVTASQTNIERINARSTEKIVFTWPESIAKTVKSCVIPTDIVVAIDLSGSMNNDGGKPPEPVTSALSAAGQFVSTLKEENQVSVVTFATKAGVTTELTNLHGAVVNSILGLKIDSAEETGYTNTAMALEVAQNELNSERHNENARRVLVILTDGLPTGSGDEDVISKAESIATRLNDDNIEIYAIGLGQGVDQSFVRNIASSESSAYFAPTGSDLEKIYSEITSSLCETGPTKIDVVAKTKPNFAPLR
jgi:Mg-chelatase subunit ChlD